MANIVDLPISNLVTPTITGATLSLDDSDSLFNLSLLPTSTLTANRTLTLDVDDGARTIRLGGNLTLAANFITSGANSLTLTTTGTTSVTLPTTGTLATLAGAEALSGKTQIDVDNLRLDGNTLSSTNTDGNINLTPNGTGSVVLGSLGAITSGTYTPTLTNVANLSASTAYICQYIRVGSVVTVSGQVDFDPTTTLTPTQLGISLPIASDFATATQCGGVAFSKLIASQGASILGDTTNNRAQLEYGCVDVTNQVHSFTFTYLIVA